MVSDGVQARIGALGAGKEWFKPWRTISGRSADDQRARGIPPELVHIQGGTLFDTGLGYLTEGQPATISAHGSILSQDFQNHLGSYPP